MRYIEGVDGKRAPGGERLIKRYHNRKLYDAAARRYVTLEELAALVAGGQEVRVLDQKSGEDLTALVLAQVVLEGVRQQTARIPRQILVQLIRLGAGRPAAEGPWPGPREAAARAHEEAERIVGDLIARGRLSLEEALAVRQDIAGAVYGLVEDAQAGILARVQRFFAPRGPDALVGLKRRLHELEGLLEAPRRRAGGKAGPGKGTAPAPRTGRN